MCFVWIDFDSQRVAIGSDMTCFYFSINSKTKGSLKKVESLFYSFKVQEKINELILVRDSKDSFSMANRQVQPLSNAPQPAPPARVHRTQL